MYTELGRAASYLYVSRRSHNLELCHSRCGPCTGSTCITWELMGDAGSPAPAWMYWIRSCIAQDLPQFPCTLVSETDWSRKGCLEKLLPVYRWLFWTDILDAVSEVGLLLSYPGIYIYKTPRGYFITNFLIQIGTSTRSTKSMPIGLFHAFGSPTRKKLRAAFPSAARMQSEICVQMTMSWFRTLGSLLPVCSRKRLVC